MKVTGSELHEEQVDSEWKKERRQARSEAEICSDQKRADGSLSTSRGPPVSQALGQALRLEGVSQVVFPSEQRRSVARRKTM